MSKFGLPAQDNSTPYASACASIAGVRTGQVSAQELTALSLERIEKRNDSIHALRNVFVERAMADAQAVDEARERGKPLGMLSGLQVVVKENIDTLPGPCPAGMNFLAGRIPQSDAWIVDRLRQAGAVILGMSVSDPGAFGVRTEEVVHPHRRGLTVGGSSGGSAAALAAGMCTGAIGTDTGGSIRIPAHCCGVAGFKPSRDRWSTRGVFPLAWSLDHVGPMARNVQDLALMFQALDEGFIAAKPPDAPVVIGWDPYFLEDASPPVCARYARVVGHLARSPRIKLKKVELPRPAEYLPVHARIFTFESAAYYLENHLESASSFPEEAKSTFEFLKTLKPYELVLAQRERERIRDRVSNLFDSVDFVVTPTLPIETPKLSEKHFDLGGEMVGFTYAMVRYTALYNNSGHPAVCMSKISGLDEYPGIQLVGSTGQDERLLAFASLLEDESFC